MDNTPIFSTLQQNIIFCYYCFGSFRDIEFQTPIDHQINFHNIWKQKHTHKNWPCSCLFIFMRLALITYEIFGPRNTLDSQWANRIQIQIQIQMLIQYSLVTDREEWDWCCKWELGRTIRAIHLLHITYHGLFPLLFFKRFMHTDYTNANTTWYKYKY